MSILGLVPNADVFFKSLSFIVNAIVNICLKESYFLKTWTALQSNSIVVSEV